MLNLIAHPLTIQAAVFVGAVCLAYLAVRAILGDHRRIALRFQTLGAPPAETDSRYGPSYSGLLALLKPLQAPLAQFLIPNDADNRTRLQAQMYRAGIFSKSALAAFSVAKIGLTVTLPLVAWSALIHLVAPGLAIGLAAVAGLVGLFLPTIWLAQKIVQRQRVLRKSLPDFLDLLLACAEGGMGVQAAIAEVARELSIAHPALAAEFEIVQREMEMGRSLETALQNLTDRTGVDELRSLATFVSQSQRFGATISEALRQLSDMLRVQREHRAEEMAHKAAVKVLIPTLLLIFPTVFVILAGPAALQIYRSLMR